MKKMILTGMLAAGLVMSCVAVQQASAYAPEGDLMRIKGYSPLIIDTANTQRSRQEWREPQAPERTPFENFFHNVWYNNWTGNFDEFGSTVIREN